MDVVSGTGNAPEQYRIGVVDTGYFRTMEVPLITGRYFAGSYAIIPNGVDLEVFNESVAPIERYADGRPTILFVGRLEKRKGLAYLIRTGVLTI